MIASILEVFIGPILEAFQSVMVVAEEVGVAYATWGRQGAGPGMEGVTAAGRGRGGIRGSGATKEGYVL